MRSGRHTSGPIDARGGVAPPALRVCLLGGLAVEGVPARLLGTRKARTVLKVLALHHDRFVSADRLIDACWPDGLPSRPLHMVLARGNLPELNGHCVEDAKTIVTVTSDIDDDGRTVWQIGGPLAVSGFKREPHAQTERVREELVRILPRLDLRVIEWSTYGLDRAESELGNNSRREAIQIFCAGNVTTGCPTKLVLAPVLAAEIAARASSPYITTPFDSTHLADWPRPETAPLPWNEAERDWWTLADSPARQQPQRRAA